MRKRYFSETQPESIRSSNLFFFFFIDFSWYEGSQSWSPLFSSCASKVGSIFGLHSMCGRACIQVPVQSKSAPPLINKLYICWIKEYERNKVDPLDSQSKVNLLAEVEPCLKLIKRCLLPQSNCYQKTWNCLLGGAY